MDIVDQIRIWLYLAILFHWIICISLRCETSYYKRHRDLINNNFALLTIQIKNLKAINTFLNTGTILCLLWAVLTLYKKYYV